ncbi:MAG TPA: hypothetical protein VHB74_12905 [Devosia sp.]|nr:hypothetical protein [Devosia sp.]
MADNDKRAGLTRTRIFILIFFGLAILLSITTIMGTLDEQKNGVLDQSQIDQLTGQAK